jgi:hypothetical protein
MFTQVATRIRGQQLPLIVIQLIIANFHCLSNLEYHTIAPNITLLVIFCHYSAAIFDKKTEELSYFL